MRCGKEKHPVDVRDDPGKLFVGFSQYVGLDAFS